jgi:hypothetical protein
MEVLQNKSTENLQQTMLAELAKSTNELRCATRDIEKASNRISFALVILNELLERDHDLRKGD